MNKQQLTRASKIIIKLIDYVASDQKLRKQKICIILRNINNLLQEFHEDYLKIGKMNNKTAIKKALCKPIVDIINNDTYDSIEDAANSTDYSRATIMRQIKKTKNIEEILLREKPKSYQIYDAQHSGFILFIVHKRPHTTTRIFKYQD